jgi:hypothetical protein
VYKYLVYHVLRTLVENMRFFGLSSISAAVRLMVFLVVLGVSVCKTLYYTVLYFYSVYMLSCFMPFVTAKKREQDKNKTA